MSGETVGGGLLDVLRESLWRETGDSNMALYTTRSSLKAGETRVGSGGRAWFNPTYCRFETWAILFTPHLPVFFGSDTKSQ